ncbi:Bug family tripartite tricarboxylate transporter substrate binding protein [Candidimonas nitroreducens]|uniref:ABC transporter substrate-binding protein n=1 Tax=Candidimonas nitroreducens TaxID=683354 RepID=A0A225MZ98_9BURK|nr:tripartite tricarboxylate transporter substrate-binding protein [Candidimonas nitroreducens]OWT64009.1 hypothetical protein CEY11_06845 [Candidimonas nitroreducens]
MKSMILASLFLACVFPGVPKAADSSSYPNRPIHIVVPFAAGGGGDFIARSWAGKFSEIMKQPVIVDNRGGGNTVIGTEVVAKAPANGYTLLLVNPSFATNPALQPHLPYKTPDDFTPVGLILTYAMGLAARSSLQADNIPQLLALGKKSHHPFTVATSGLGSASYLASELFGKATGLDLLNVSYRGAGPAMLDVAGGNVDLAFTGFSQIKPLLASRRVKLLGTSGQHRLKSAPDTKTIAEQGVKDFAAFVWWGILAPAGTPDDIILKVNKALRQSLSDPKVVQRLEVIDGEVQVTSPAEFGSFLHDEISRWSTLSAPKPVKAPAS